MSAAELLNKIVASGADEKGIRDRFCGNDDLYESCFLDFMEEPSFVALGVALHTRNYQQAFEAAHALKGLSGNLGITGFYNAIRILSDSLRSAQFDQIDEQYAEVERQYERLRRIIRGVPEPAEETGPVELPPVEEKPGGVFRADSLMRDKGVRLFVYLLCAAVAVIVVIGLLFFWVNTAHTRKVVEESGQHLTEISNQIQLYIEESIETDWKIAQSVSDSFLDSTYVDDDPAVFNMLQRKQAVWGVSDLMLYTEKGYCIYANGTAEPTDVASMTAYRARKDGKYLSILNSSLIYTVPLDTPMTFRGSAIVAISVVRNMSSFLDDMEFSSFGSAAWMYLTDQSGVVVSALTSPSATQAYNMRAIIQDMDIASHGETCSSEDFISCPKAEVFTLSDAGGKIYGVSAPVMTEVQPMRLFYFVPEDAVNSIMGDFSKQLSVFSMVIIFLFGAGACSVSLVVYKSRKKMFDQAILTRERMFDMLVKNTKTAFGLFTANRPQPEYQSANVTEVIGDAYWMLEKTDRGFRIYNDKRKETENIALVNQALQDWDGKSTFRSGYLSNQNSATPAYFVFELYPVDDRASGFVGIAHDVTPVYAREETVRSAMESAKQANEAKTRFLSSMSHDIRTPMNAIMNMSSFALENIDQPKKLGTYLRVIHESAEHLLHLINDVLDMSRIERGLVEVQAAPFDIGQEIQRQIEMIRPMCNAKKQTLMTNISGLMGTVVSGDALKFSQIVINLLSNAMKFTPERGAIRLIAKEIPSLRDTIVSVRLSVEDTGIGIGEDDLKRVFEPFHRSNHKAVSGIEGTGLGLTIVKNYIDAMGGTIRCESELGEGSTFTVELYFQKAMMPVKQAAPQGDLTNATFLGMHALLAEDNHVNQMIAKEMLERMGILLDIVEDGGAAVQAFREAKPYTYDLIYMDIQMPVLDGYAATVEIRASDHPQAKTIPIIAMTANAFAEDIEKARMAGMDGYVDKPIVSFKLAEQTRKAIQRIKGEAE